ncbi:MAG: hypothetical protein HY905_09870 [Deltaproteobacteria bacterium]|nr:hypothetical protein [Deltaproteobacteria bacterium]
MTVPNHPRVVLRVLVLCGLGLACGPRTPPTGPGPEGEEAGAATGPTAEELRSECTRLFYAGVAARASAAMVQLEGVVVRSAVLLEAVGRSASGGRPATEAVALGRAVLADPAVRRQLMEAIAQSSGDVGVLVSLGSALLGGDDLEQRLLEAGERAQQALTEASRASGLGARVLALPDVGTLLEALFPSLPFQAAVASAEVVLLQSGAVADAEVRLIVPGDVEATRVAVDAWASRPAGLGCEPLVSRFPLAESVADLPAAGAALDAVAGSLLPSVPMREETIALARDLLADAGFRLALDELFVRLLRGDAAPAISSAAEVVVALPVLPQAIAAWASRLTARRAELPDLTPVLLSLASDPEMASILRRFVEVVVMTDGCIGL